MRGGSEPDQSRRRLVLLIVPIAVTVGMGVAATALTPVLAAEHPLLLIILDSRTRNLVLARHVSLELFLLVGTFRRLLSDPLYYLLGRHYGQGAVRWIERRTGGGGYFRFLERIFGKAAYPIVFLTPGPLVCALAGETGMRPLVFGILNVSGTVGAVFAIRGFGDVLGDQVDAILRFFDRNLVMTTGLTIAIVVLGLVVGRLRGTSETQTMDEIEDELEGAAISEIEQGVEAHGDPGPPSDRLDGEQHAGHE